MKLMSPYILFGLYYGLLTTLPMGPSQIVCVRSFLLGGNLSGLISLSGSMLAQLIIISSIHYSPIYSLLLKPHILTVVAIPYTFILCLVIKDSPDYQALRPILSLKDSRVVKLFLLSFIFQMFNPILLPNPVLARLTYLVFFRYSTNKAFLFATLLGWLIGQAAFNYLSKLLLTRVQKDSPTIYLLTKRSIYTTFSIVSVAQAVSYLGRAPVSFWTKKFMNESPDKEMAFWEIAEYPDLSWWCFKPWPISFFDPSRGNRGNRFVKNCRSDLTSSFYKERTSTYFFTKCFTDGKERLSFATLPSLSISEKYAYRSIAKSHRSMNIGLVYKNWASEKLIQAKFFQEELRDRVKILDTGSSFSGAIGKRTRLTSGKRNKIPCNYDPFANNLRIRIPVPQTFITSEDLGLTGWEWDELDTSKKSRKRIGTARENVLKGWISAKNRNCKKRVFNNYLPWKTLSRRSRRVFQFMFKNRVLYDYDIQKILEKIKSSPEAKVTWEEILNLDYEDRTLFLTYLKEEENCYQSNQISLFKPFLLNRYEKETAPTIGKKRCKIREIEDLTMDLARNIAIYFENDFDVPGGDTDFRYRKLRNVGITSPKGKPRSAKLVKRYARISDFRRKLLKGSMRSRRRKTLLWKTLQEKIRSAFFLRLAEIPILFKLPIEQLTPLSPKIQTRPGEVKKNVNYILKEQILDIFPLTKENLTAESKLARSAIAARSDIGPIHNGRGYMLVFQSRFRKFIKLPVLIALKSFVRIILRQESEWKKDWMRWKKEIHINCTFDGEEFSQDDLPPRWLREGIQIKIVYPVRLNLWSIGRSRKQITLQKKYKATGLSENYGIKRKKKLKQNKPKFTYLTVLGYQTDVPFGTIQKESSFWKPMQKRLIWICRRVLPSQIKHAYQSIGLNLEKILKLKSTSFTMKGFNPSLNDNLRKKKPSNSNFKKNPWINTLDPTNEMGRSKSTTFKEFDKSIAIGGEIHTATSLSNQIVAQDYAENDFLSDSPVVDSVNVLNKRVEENTEKNLVDPVSIEVLSNQPNSAKLESFKQILDSAEMLVNLRVFLAECFEEYSSIFINWFFTIDRIFRQSFHEFLAFYKQLARILKKIKSKKNLLPKDIFLQFGPSSQACFYVDLWNVGLDKNLDLGLFLFKSETLGRETRRDTYSNVISDSPPTIGTIFHCDSTTPSSVKKGDYVIDFVTSFDEKVEKIKIDNEFLGEHIAKYLKEWGFSNKLCNLDEKIWNNWLDCFSKYNLPASAWHEIAPQKWKVSLNRLEIEKNVLNKLKYNVSRRKVHNYSIYAERDFLIKKLINFNRIQKHRNLLQNLTDFVRNGDIQTTSVRQKIILQKSCCKNRIQKIVELGKSKIGNFVQCQKFNQRLKYNLKQDLMLWLDPDVIKTKSFLQNKNKTRRSQNPIIKESDQYNLVLDINSRFQEVSNELYEVMSDEREDANYIFRWKWRFETELDKIKNLIALTRMLENDQDLVTLCANTEIDSDLLTFRFNTTTRLNLIQNLSFIPSHRLPLVFDDQNLLYKTINPTLKLRSISKNRAKKRLYGKINSDSYISKMFHLVAHQNCNESPLYNIDDLLLLRRRREFRFLRCFLISRNLHPWVYSDQIITEIPMNKKSKGLHPLRISKISETQKIKRFLWPSHRLEELACTGRFCLGAITESRFAALKFRMYPIIPS